MAACSAGVSTAAPARSVLAVRTVPAAMAFTRTPAAPNSNEAVRVSASTPALAAAYGAPNGIAASPLTEAMCTMLPPRPWASSRVPTACVVMNAVCRLSSVTAANVSGAMVAIGAH